jgi:Tfp pilus assembly protein PilF
MTSSPTPESHQQRARTAALVRQAVALHQAGKPGEALAVYDQVLAADPANVHALMFGGVALLETGRPARAIETLEAAVAARPDLADAHFYLANAYQTTARPDDAEAAYRLALDLSPKDPRIHNNLGVVFQGRGETGDAAASFRRAIAIEPGYADAHNNLCQACIKLELFDDAVAAGSRSIGLDADEPSAHGNYGTALIHAGRTGEAVAILRQADAKWPGAIDNLNTLAMALIAHGDARSAIETLDRCLATDPGNVAALASKCVALGEAGESAARGALAGYDDLVRPFRVAPAPGFDGIAGFNRALARHVLDHPTLSPSHPTKATRLGLHTGDLLAEPKGPVAALERIIRDTVDEYVATLPAGYDHPFLAKKPGQWELEVWALVLGAQGHEIPHIHLSGWLSGCYYVQTSDVLTSEDDGRQGWIEFGEPLPVYRARSASHTKWVRPEEGTMVLFPSFVFHRTAPFVAEAKRICIAFDVRAAG